MASNFARRRLIRDRLRNNTRRSRGNGGPPRLLQVFIALVGLGVIAVAVAGGVGFGVYRSYANGLESPDELIARQPSGGAQIFDRNGTLLYEYVDDRSGLRSPVKLEDMSPWIIAATISTEDNSFWTNPGVNTRGLVRAGLEGLHLRSADAGTNTGGSSITQQLVKNLYIPEKDRYKRSVSRKMKETIYAFELSDRYSKNQILEWYLNQIPYGGIYNGVEAASLGYFGKHAKDLTLPEAAMLAGIPASPNEYSPVTNPLGAVKRRNEVLRLMQSRNRVEVTDAEGAKLPATRFQINEHGENIDATDKAFYISTLAPLNVAPQRFPVQAPHWVFDYIEPQIVKLYGKEALYRGGLRVTTTLDINLQNKAQAAIEQWVSEFEATAHGHNGAMVAIDPKTSEVLVMVGSRDYFADTYYEDCDCTLAGRNNNATALNSPGSTLKPFTYAAAFEQLGWGPETEILDTPITYQDGDKPFTPRNPSGDFHGVMSIRNALGNSMNIPAFKTALYVGVPQLVNEYKKFGIASLDGRGFGPSVTIGGVDVSLLDVTYAYSVLAGGGTMRGVPTTKTFEDTDHNRKLDPVSILQITRATDGSVVYPTTQDHRVQVQENPVVSPQTAYQIQNILTDPSAFCITYGCGALSIGRQWGVKTGTSEPFENSRAIGETWTYGFTPDLVAGVWAGNAGNQPMYNITSTSISYRAVRDFMIEALADTPPSTFDRPGGMVEIDTCTPSGLKATDACPRRVHNLLPAETAPKKDDDWWRRVRVDIRDGKIATELTPPQFVQQRFGLVIPDGLSDFTRSQSQEWARYLNAGSTPTEKSDGQSPVVISAPREGDRVNGIVAVTGKADTPGFVAYRLEYLQTGGVAWSPIIRSESRVPSVAGLGLWNTAGLPEGTYTIRLVLEDRDRGELSTFITVKIGGGGGTSPRGTPTPKSNSTPGGVFQLTPVPTPTIYNPAGGR